MPTSSARVRRSRVLVAVVLIACVAAVAAIVGTQHTSPGSRGRASTSASTQRSTTTTTTAAPRVNSIGTYSVATTSLTLATAGLAPTDDQLPTAVWYPVADSSAAHRGARHRFPLLVFSQGFAQPVSSYSALITDWASAGFVVAGPTYPHTSPSSPTNLDRADLVHHPADLRTVITTVVDAGRQPGSILSGRIDGSEIGLVGQSDGGDVSLAVADNSCCRIAGVKAAAILSGAEYAGFGGQYFALGTAAGPPLLVVQGDEDAVNPPVCSAQFYDAATPPKYYLDLLDATHLGPYTQPTTWEPVVATVTTDFFDAELAGERAALEQMTGSGDVPDVAEFSTASTAPPAYGTCPTAP